MPDLFDALEDAIREHCIEAMREHSRADLNQLKTNPLVAEYAAWRARFPSVRPRLVHESDTFAASEFRTRYADGLAAIRHDIEAGSDLTRYLSSLVRFADERDLMLAHAGIHHLHLSDLMEKWRVERTEHVLFVAFRPDDAYLIDVYPHEPDGANWAEKRILETIVRNWPDAGILHSSSFATGLTQDYDDDTRQELRRAGVNLAIEIDGRVWSSFGATVVGTPIMSARMGMKVHWDLYYMREAGIEELEARLREVAPEAAPHEWRAAVHDDHYGFHAEQIATFVRFGPLLAE